MISPHSFANHLSTFVISLGPVLPAFFLPSSYFFCSNIFLHQCLCSGYFPTWRTCPFKLWTLNFNPQSESRANAIFSRKPPSIPPTKSTSLCSAFPRHLVSATYTGFSLPTRASTKTDTTSCLSGKQQKRDWHESR